MFQHTDVSSEPEIQSAVERAVKEYGRLDTMFNNAGLVGALGPIEAVSAEDWDRTIAVLLRSVFLGIKYAVERDAQAGGGSIISTSSVASFLPSAYGAAYAAAKGAVINLDSRGRSLAWLRQNSGKLHLSWRHNTPICGAFPGFSDSAAVAQLLDYAQTIPRSGRPEDIASMVLFLGSDESEWVRPGRR